MGHESSHKLAAAPAAATCKVLVLEQGWASYSLQVKSADCLFMCLDSVATLTGCLCSNNRACGGKYMTLTFYRDSLLTPALENKRPQPACYFQIFIPETV